MLAAEVVQLGTDTVVWPRGAIDLPSVDILRDALTGAGSPKATLTPSLTQRNCAFDVQGTEVIHAASAELADHHRRLVIANATHAIDPGDLLQ